MPFDAKSARQEGARRLSPDAFGLPRALDLNKAAGLILIKASDGLLKQVPLNKCQEASDMGVCEFCAEFQTDGPARFRSIYRGVATSRVVARTAHFIAVPTLGQLFEGSLLILPRAHVETCASLENDARNEMLGLLDEMLIRCAAFGSPIFFEHGATEASGGSCGIHHAHLHVVPLPTTIDVALLFPEATYSNTDLARAWTALAKTDHYLLIGNAEKVRFRDLETDPGQFPSQFFRRRLAEHFELEKPWDWRSYSQVEPALVRTLAEASTNAVQL